MKIKIKSIVNDLDTKGAYFISTHAIITIELFLYHVWKLCSIPTCVVFNKDL